MINQNFLGRGGGGGAKQKPSKGEYGYFLELHNNKASATVVLQSCVNMKKGHHSGINGSLNKTCGTVVLQTRSCSVPFIVMVTLHCMPVLVNNCVLGV